MKGDDDERCANLWCIRWKLNAFALELFVNEVSHKKCELKVISKFAKQKYYMIKQSSREITLKLPLWINISIQPMTEYVYSIVFHSKYVLENCWGVRSMFQSIGDRAIFGEVLRCKGRFGRCQPEWHHRELPQQIDWFSFQDDSTLPPKIHTVLLIID